MAILTFLIGAILFVCGLGALALSVDLVPTEMGRLYAESGVIFVSSSGIVWAVAALVYQIQRISEAPRRPRSAPEDEPPAVEPVERAPTTSPEAEPADDDEINVNRRGHLPSLHAVEEALAEPEAPPHVIGRYAAGGARYVVFSDGAIEAETEEGGMRFASMDEFKAYIATRAR